MPYQDYVIKDGKLIGEFEKMYQECVDPWMQSGEVGISYSRHDTILTVKRFGLKNVLEVGSGLGYFTSLLSQNCLDTLFVGMDISDTAVKKARTRYPQLTFVRGGVLDIGTLFDVRTLDGIIFAEICWYILDDLRDVLEFIKTHFKGLLIVNQVFYYTGQKYGCEYFSNQEELINYFNLKAIVKNSSHAFNHDAAYETHTVFDLR